MVLVCPITNNPFEKLIIFSVFVFKGRICGIEKWYHPSLSELFNCREMKVLTQERDWAIFRVVNTVRPKNSESTFTDCKVKCLVVLQTTEKNLHLYTYRKTQSPLEMPCSLSSICHWVVGLSMYLTWSFMPAATCWVTNPVLIGSAEERRRKQSMFCTIILLFRYSLRIEESSANFIFFGIFQTYCFSSQKSVLIRHNYNFFWSLKA